MFHPTSLKSDRKLIKMIDRKPNHIILGWEHIFEKGNRYKLQILSIIKEWQTIYWGKNVRFKVENLTPCTCYSFRIKPDSFSDGSEDSWTHFTAATDEGPFYSIMHLTRYVKLGKTSVVRKIAHVSSYLLDTENRENKTPIVLAIEARDLQMISLLISLGANVNKPNCYNKRTPLMIAVDQGQMKIATFLMDKGADVCVKDINGLNILHFAVDSDNLKSVKFCVQVLKKVDFRDNKGWTPLLRAVILGMSQEIVEFLIENGADITIKDNNGIDFETHCGISKYNFKKYHT